MNIRTLFGTAIIATTLSGVAQGAANGDVPRTDYITMDQQFGQMEAAGIVK